MIERTYLCDLCRDKRPVDKLVGLSWVGVGWKEVSPRETERHLCFKCLSSIQGIPTRCGAGFRCEGGPQCTSDHK